MVKPYVLRYWEQEFTQLRPMKRRGNRRYYQHHEVLLVRRIRELLYEKRFTISGARDRLAESSSRAGAAMAPDAALDDALLDPRGDWDVAGEAAPSATKLDPPGSVQTKPDADWDLRRELLAIRRLLAD
jgi:DNA-binding transcriptional MerR regulator